MAVKVQTIKDFLGFGDGLRRGEYYFSQGMHRSRAGIKPGWVITESINSETLVGLQLIQWFCQRKEGNIYTYGVDNNGNIYKVLQYLNNWALAHDPTTLSYGNGLAVDQSERLIYAQARYLGMFDGATWTDTWKDFGSDEGNMVRPIELWENMVFIGNKNKIAGYTGTGDGTDFNTNLFDLPSGFIIKDIKVGKNGILIGANKGNQGVLVLWDGYSDRAIAPWIWTQGNIFSIAKYKGQWIVSAGNEFIITNGYTVQHLCYPPDSQIQDAQFGPAIPSGMLVKDHYLFVTSQSGAVNRRKPGLWIYDLETRLWEFCPISNYCLHDISLGGLFVDNLYNFYCSYASDYPSKKYIGKIYNGPSTKSFYISDILEGGNTKKIAEGLVFNLGFDLEYYYVYSNPNLKITTKIFDFKRPLWGYGQTKVASTELNKIIVDGTIVSMNNAEVGDEVTILEGVNAGEIRHIISISGKDTTTEIWTLDSNLPALTEQYIMMNVCPFKKIGTQTISSSEIKDYYFPIKNTPQGKKFLIKIVLEGGNMIPEISSFSFVFNDLGII